MKITPVQAEWPLISNNQCPPRLAIVVGLTFHCFNTRRPQKRKRIEKEELTFVAEKISASFVRTKMKQTKVDNAADTQVRYVAQRQDNYLDRRPGGFLVVIYAIKVRP